LKNFGQISALLFDIQGNGQCVSIIFPGYHVLVILAPGVHYQTTTRPDMSEF